MADTGASPQPDMKMSQSPPNAPVATHDDEPKYGGYTRFEIELEVRRAPLPCSSSLLLSRATYRLLFLALPFLPICRLCY